MGYIKHNYKIVQQLSKETTVWTQKNRHKFHKFYTLKIITRTKRLKPYLRSHLLSADKSVKIWDPSVSEPAKQICAKLSLYYLCAHVSQRREAAVRINNWFNLYLCLVLIFLPILLLIFQEGW
jgi:hypothetical protein